MGGMIGHFVLQYFQWLPDGSTFSEAGPSQEGRSHPSWWPRHCPASPYYYTKNAGQEIKSKRPSLRKWVILRKPPNLPSFYRWGHQEHTALLFHRAVLRIQWENGSESTWETGAVLQLLIITVITGILAHLVAPWRQIQGKCVLLGCIWDTRPGRIHRCVYTPTVTSDLLGACPVFSLYKQVTRVNP